MKYKVSIAVLVTLLVAGCQSETGEAQKISDALRCTMPEGVLRFEPLLAIGQNAQKEKLARELIELQRRQPISDGDWHLASTFVYLDQSELARMPNIMQGDVDFIDGSIKNKKRGLINVNVLELAQDRQRLYNEECQKYISANKSMAQNLEKLIALREEAKQPWLDANKKLPCGIQEKKGCYK